MSAAAGYTGPSLAARPRGAIRTALSRASRQFRRWMHRVQSALGMRRGVKVRGAYFKELSAESLQRALSRKGRGWKDYRVTFPDGSKMVIRASARRVYDDVMGPLGFDAGQGLLAPLLEIIRPGSRFLLINSGTGAAGAWLGAAVGTSGAVVALEEDEQSVMFAQKRYARANVSFEHGALEELTGETAGSFEGAAVLRPLPAELEDRPLTELWRVLAPGGWLLASCERGQGSRVTDLIRALPSGDAAGIRSDIADGPDLVFATKLADPASPQHRKPERPPDDPGPPTTAA